MVSLASIVIWLFDATKNSTPSPTYPTGFIVALIVCNATKRNPIGGWLMFFFWQLYSGLLMTGIFFSSNIQSYVRENFADTERYYFFLLSAVPVVILYLAQVATGTVLLSVRTWDLLKLLRWLIAAELVAAVGSVLIDSVYFPNNVALNFLTIVPESLWLAYLFRSVRVKHVFKRHDWDIAVNSLYPLKPKAVAT